MKTNVHPVFPAALFITLPKQKQSKCPSADEQKTKMWDIHKVGYYSATKRNEAVIDATTSMNHKNITLYERSQTQKDTDYVTPFI